jgi:hypothetical protein
MSEQHTKTTCNCGCMGAGPMVTDVLRRLGPSHEVRRHFSAAHVEILKGIRAFLDEQIAAHTHTSSGPEHGTQGTRIPVE